MIIAALLAIGVVTALDKVLLLKSENVIGIGKIEEHLKIYGDVTIKTVGKAGPKLISDFGPAFTHVLVLASNLPCIKHRSGH